VAGGAASTKRVGGLLDAGLELLEQGDERHPLVVAGGDRAVRARLGRGLDGLELVGGRGDRRERRVEVREGGVVVIDVTIDRASAMSAGTARGSLREAIEHLTLTVLAMGFAPCLLAANERAFPFRERRPGTVGRGDGFVERPRGFEDRATSSTTVEGDTEERGDGSRERHDPRAPVVDGMKDRGMSREERGCRSKRSVVPWVRSVDASMLFRSPSAPRVDAREQRRRVIEKSGAARSPVRAAPPNSRVTETPSRATHLHSRSTQTPSHTTHTK
jgi:hypothetical protein